MMSKNFLLLIFCAVLTLQLCYTIGIHCPKESYSAETKESPFPQPEKVKLGDNYETTIRFTNWKSNETAKFVERNYNGSIVISKRTSKMELSWFKTADRLIYVETNTTNDHQYACTGAPTEAQQNVYGLSPTLLKFFGEQVFSFGSILNSLVLNQEYNHTMLENSTGITAGVETIRWRGCATNVTENGKNIQVNVFMTGDLSKQMPYNENFRNPQVMAFHIQVYKDLHLPNTTEIVHNISEHISFDVVTLDLVNLDQSELSFIPPRGKWCSGLPKASLPPHFSGPFLSANLEYVDPMEKVVNKIELLYNEQEHLFSVAMDFQTDQDLPFIGSSSLLTGRARVVHDFYTGLEYTLSRDGRVCKSVQPIDSHMGNVRVDNNILFLRSPGEMLFNLTQQDFYYAGKVSSEEGVVLDAYVSKTAEREDGRTVLEMLYYSPESSLTKVPLIHSILHYHQNKSGEVLKKTVVRFNFVDEHERMASHLVYPCLQDYGGGNIFFLNLQNATMEDLKKVGLQQVEHSVTQALAHAANFSVLRLTHFMFSQMDDKLLACFVISEKSDVDKPAKTAYLQRELSVNEVHQSLNSTINAANVFTVHIPAMDPKQAGLTILSSEFGQLPALPAPVPKPDFVGYSGRAMFVLSFFMFIFGAVLVIASFVFYSKRQSIRGMAYQVFE